MKFSIYFQNLNFNSKTSGYEELKKHVEKIFIELTFLTSKTLS